VRELRETSQGQDMCSSLAVPCSCQWLTVAHCGRQRPALPGRQAVSVLPVPEPVSLKE
jgi:hypothetical protein